MKRSRRDIGHRNTSLSYFIAFIGKVEKFISDPSHKFGHQIQL